MQFKRIESQTHQIDDTSLRTSYDRYTGKLTLSSLRDGAVLASKNIFLSPFSSRSFCLNEKQYQLRASWGIIWQSCIVEVIKPHNSTRTIIKELLPQRRRRTIIVCSYVAMINLIKIAFIMTAPI